MPFIPKNRIKPLSVQGLGKLYDIYFVGVPTRSWKAWLTALPCIVPEARLFEYSLFGEDGITLQQKEQSGGHTISNDIPETIHERHEDELSFIQSTNITPSPGNVEESGRRAVSKEGVMKSQRKHPRLSLEILETEANLLLHLIQQPDHGIEEERRNVVLVGHGLGSIVIKQALILANAEPKFYEVALRTIRVVTLHSPHATPSIEAWEDCLWDVMQEANLEFDGRRTEVLAELAVSADRISSHFYCHASQYDLQHLPQCKAEIYERHTRSTLAPLALLNQGLELEATKEPTKSGEEKRDDQEKLFRTEPNDSITVREMFLDFLSSLSTSNSSIYRTHGLCIPEQVPDIGVYQQFIDRWNDEIANGAKQISVHVIGSYAVGRASLLKALVQRLRNWFCEQPAFTLMVLEISLNSPTRRSVILSLIRQILSQCPSLFSRFRELYLEHSKEHTWTEETMLNFLFEIFWFLRAWKVCFRVEGLDTGTGEMEEFIKTLERHLVDLDCDYVFIVSSERVSMDLPSQTALTFNIDTTTKQSLRRYIQAKIPGLARSQNSLHSIQAEILQRLESIDLPQKSTHLYVSLLSHALPFSTLDAVESALRKWSIDADDLYRSSVESLIREQPGAIAWCALIVSCVLHAERPLRLREIAVAAAIHPVIDNEKSNFRSRITLSIKEDIERYLHFLLRIDDDTVLLLDSSTKDFLLDKLHQHRSLKCFELWGHHQLTNLYLDYLAAVISTKWDLCRARLDRQYASNYGNDPELEFLDYAVRHWPIHYSQAKDGGDTLQRRVLSFLENFGTKWYQLFHSNPSSQETKDSAVTVLEIASELGFSSTTRTLLENTNPVNSTDLGRALAFAVRANHQELAEILLNTGARNSDTILDAARNGNVDLLRVLCKRHTKEENHQAPATAILHVAAQAGQLKVVEEALALGANVLETHTHKRTPLHAAVIGGSINVIEHLLKEEGCSIYAQDDAGWTPLMLAARLGQVSALRKLCAAVEADQTAMAPHWQNALLVAIQEDSPFAAGVGSEAVKTILSLGRGSMCSPVWPNENKPTLLYYACCLGSLEILEQLINYLGTGRQIPSELPGDKSLLHVAAGRGHIEIVRLLLSYSNDFSVVEGGPTAIELASSSGHLPIVEMLYSKYPDPGPQTDTDLLLRACDNGHLPVVRYLLDNPSEPRDKEQALSAAVLKGHMSIVRLLFEESLTKCQYSDSTGETLLHRAAAAGHIEVAQFLIEKGADVDSLNRVRQSPLHLAASRGIAGIVELLLVCGAQANQQTKDKETALHLAVEWPDVVSLLVEHKVEIDTMDYNEETPLHLAARGAYCESVKHLINGGACVDKTAGRGLTPFHLAIGSGSQQCVEEIWNAKPDMTLDCYKRRPPALYAVECKRIEAVRFLSKIARDTLDNQDEEGVTALFVAVENKLEDHVEALLETKVNTDVQNSEKQTPLHRAVLRGYVKIVEMLMKAGADASITDNTGCTPLHLSFYNVEIMQLLLENGAPIDAIGGSNRWTALMKAIYWEVEDSVDLILKYRPALHFQDIKGRTALHIAVQENAAKILQALVDACSRIDLDILDMTDESGTTALQYAHLKPPVALILVRAGADALREEKEGTTFLRSAINDWTLEDGLEITNACIAQVVKNGAAVDSIQFEKLFEAIRIGSSTEDEDGWCLSHFLHHGTDWSELLEKNGLEKPEQSTKTPTSLLIPDNWACEYAEGFSVEISNEGSQATYHYEKGGTCGDYGVLSVRANHPFSPRGTGNSYFEVKITINDRSGTENLAARSRPIVAIGLCGKSTSLKHAFVGWKETSVAYHGDNGRLYEEGGISVQQWDGNGREFSHGNTVGCGIDWSKNALYFTRDGQLVGRYESKLLGRKLYPAISFGSGSCCVTANFGTGEFRFSPGLFE